MTLFIYHYTHCFLPTPFSCSQSLSRQAFFFTVTTLLWITLLHYSFAHAVFSVMISIPSSQFNTTSGATHIPSGATHITPLSIQSSALAVCGSFRLLGRAPRSQSTHLLHTPYTTRQGEACMPRRARFCMRTRAAISTTDRLATCSAATHMPADALAKEHKPSVGARRLAKLNSKKSSCVMSASRPPQSDAHTKCISRRARTTAPTRAAMFLGAPRVSRAFQSGPK